MKRFLSVLFALALIGLPASPVSAASSVADRIAAIEEEYGVRVEYDGYGAAYIDRQLSHIETALPHLGAIFTGRVNEIAVAHARPEFRIKVTSSTTIGHPGAAGSYYISREESTVHLFPTDSYMPNGWDIIHEFGHAAVYISNGQADILSEIQNINGKYQGSAYDSNRYVTQYAATNVSEDFAEMFAHMVVNGGANPVDVGSDTVLYYKYLCIQQYLVEQLGMNSRISQQACAFMKMPVPQPA